MEATFLFNCDWKRMEYFAKKNVNRWLKRGNSDSSAVLDGPWESDMSSER